jgi:hypothetical protein
VERLAAPHPGQVRLVEHANLAAALALDAQEPRREGPERLQERFLRRRQWFSAVWAPMPLFRDHGPQPMPWSCRRTARWCRGEERPPHSGERSGGQLGCCASAEVADGGLRTLPAARRPRHCRTFSVSRCLTLLLPCPSARRRIAGYLSFGTLRRRDCCQQCGAVFLPAQPHRGATLRHVRADTTHHTARPRMSGFDSPIAPACASTMRTSRASMRAAALAARPVELDQRQRDAEVQTEVQRLTRKQPSGPFRQPAHRGFHRLINGCVNSSRPPHRVVMGDV